MKTKKGVRNQLEVVSDELLKEQFPKVIGSQRKRQFYGKYYMNPSFIKEYGEKLDWEWMCRLQPLNLSTIEKYQHHIDWNIVAECQELSESFMKKHSHKINFYKVSQYQTLSEEFMLKHKYELDWEWLSSCQHFSLDFLLNNRDLIVDEDLQTNPNISNKTLHDYKMLAKLLNK